MAMPRVFSLVGENMTILSASPTTLLFINPPATGPDITTRRIWISQAGTIVLRQRMNIVTQVTAFPTLVSATPRPHNSYDTASLLVGGTAGAAGTCGVNASAEGAGAKTVFIADAFDAMAGYLRITTPEENHDMASGSSSGLGVTFPAATGVSPNTLGWIVGVTYSEE
jgi:hypothetical protein